MHEPIPRRPAGSVQSLVCSTLAEACRYDSMKPAEEDPRALLRCLDGALLAATERLVFDLKAVVARWP